MLQSKRKVGLTFVVVLVVLAILAGAVYILFNQSNQSVNARNTRLDTPTISGVTITDEDRYILSYSAIEDAISYEISINGAITSTRATQFDITSKLVQYGDYIIKVRAICSILSFSSFYSDEYIYSYTYKLQPLTINPIVNDTISWNTSSYAEAIYRLSVKSGDNEIEITNITNTSYSLSTAVAKFNLKYTPTRTYEFKVQAYSVNASVSPSVYSNSVSYTYNAQLPNFLLTLNTDYLLTFDPIVSDCAIDYQLYLITSPTLVAIGDTGYFDASSRQGTKLNLTPIIDEHLVTFDLTSVISSCTPEQYAVYVNAIPVPTDPLAQYTAPSTSINVELFKREAQLSVPTNIKLEKVYNYLEISWDTVKYANDTLLADYNYQILYEDIDTQFKVWKEGTIDSLNIGAGALGIPLDGERAGLGIFKLRVQAYSPINKFYLPSDWVESTTINAVSTLSTPTDFKVTQSIDLLDITFDWSSVSNNSGYQIAIVDAQGEHITNASGQPVIIDVQKNATQKNIVDDLQQQTPGLGVYYAKIRAIGQGYFNNSLYSQLVRFNLLKQLDIPIFAEFDDPQFDDTEIFTPITIDRQTATTILYWTWAGDINNLGGWKVDVYSGDVLATEQDIDINLITTTEKDDKTYYILDISKFLNKSGSNFSAQITAVAKPLDDENFYTNSTSELVNFTYNKYFVMDESTISFNQEAGSNTVTMSWGSNTAIDTYGAGFTIKFVDDQQETIDSITIQKGDATTNVDITEYLTPGINNIWLYANLSGSFVGSDAIKTTYSYTYTLVPFDVDNILIEVTFEDETKTSPPQYTLKFPVVRYADKYVVYINDVEYTSVTNIYDATKLGTDISIIIPVEKLVVFKDNTISIQISSNNVTFVQGTPVVEGYTFYNAYNVPAPTLSNIIDFADDNSGGTISWSWSNLSDLTTQYQLKYEYNVLRNGETYEATLIQGTDNSLKLEKGNTEYTYQVSVRARICDNSGTVLSSSPYAIEYYIIGLTLAPPTSINVDNTTNTIYWDAVNKANLYEVCIYKDRNKLTQENQQDLILTTSATSLIVSGVMANNGVGNYQFQVRSLRQGDPSATSDWSSLSPNLEYVNALNAPTSLDCIIDTNLNTVKLSTIAPVNSNMFKIYISTTKSNISQVTTPLVFTLLGSNGTMQYTQQNGYVVFDITETMRTYPAGEYVFGVSAGDTSGVYSDSAIFIKDEICTYAKRHAMPSDVSVTQTGFTSSNYEVTLQFAKPQPLDTNVYPDFLVEYADKEVTIKAADYKDNANQYIVIALKDGIDIGTYIFTITALDNITDNNFYLSSDSYSIKFTVNKMFATPTLSVTNSFIKNDETTTLQFENITGTSTKFDMLITYYGDVANNNAINTKEITGLFATPTLDDKYTFALDKTHLFNNTNIAPGKYEVQVRYCGNANIYSSNYSNKVTIYYSQDLPKDYIWLNGVADGANYVYATIPSDIFNVVPANTIVATITYTKYGTDTTGSISATGYDTANSRFIFTITDGHEILDIWNIADANKNLIITLTFPQTTVNINGTSYTYFTTNTLDIAYTVGELNAPIIRLETGDTIDVLYWPNNNLTANSPTYSYEVTVTDLLTSTTQTFNGTGNSYSYAKSGSLYQYNITVTVSSGEKTASTTSTFYSSSMTGLLPEDINIAFDKDTKIYTLSWDNPYYNKLPAAATFSGYDYISLGGVALSFTGSLANQIHSIEFTRDVMQTMIMISNRNTADYTLDITLGTVASTNSVLYESNNISTEIRLPILIEDSVTGLNITFDETTQKYTANWNSIEGAELYNIELGTMDGNVWTATVVDETPVAKTFSHSINGTDITSLMSMIRVPGNYTARISVAGDEQWIYVTTNFESTSYYTIEVKVAYDPITDLKFTSRRDDISTSTEFTKTLTWTISNQYEPTQTTFAIFIKPEGANNPTTPILTFIPTIDDINGDKITCKLNSVLNNYTNYGIGKYSIWVVIQANGLYLNSPSAYVDSQVYENDLEVASNGLVYNQFVLTKPKGTIILPDAFGTYEADSTGGHFTVDPDYQKLYNAYIQAFGYNTKYLLLTEKLSIANTLTVLCNNTGCTDNKTFYNNAWSNTDAENKVNTSIDEFKKYIVDNGVLLSNWSTQSNTIKIYPEADNKYYYYPNNDYTNVTLTINPVLYYKLPTITPNVKPIATDDEIIQQLYLTLVYTSDASSLYTTSGYYTDGSSGIDRKANIPNRILLNIYKEKNDSTFTSVVSNYIINLNDYSTGGIYGNETNTLFDLRELIKSMGPGTYKFEVCDINDWDDTTTHTGFINSDFVDVEYTYTYKFTISATDNITATTLDYNINNTENYKADDTNIYITLDQPDFDVTATYTVTMNGTTTVNGVTYTRATQTYSVQVKLGTTPSVPTASDGFSIVNGVLLFNTLTYINDTTLDGYYLGGVYSYTISVEFTKTECTYLINDYSNATAEFEGNATQNQEFTYRTQYTGYIQNGAYIELNSEEKATLTFTMEIPESIANQSTLIDNGNVAFVFNINTKEFTVYLTPTILNNNTTYTFTYDVTNYIRSGGASANTIIIKYLIPESWQSYYYNTVSYNSKNDTSFDMPDTLPLPNVTMNGEVNNNNIVLKWSFTPSTAMKNDPKNTDGTYLFYYTVTITRTGKSITLILPQMKIDEIITSISNFDIYKAIKEKTYSITNSTKITITHEGNVADWINGNYLIPDTYTIAVGVHCSNTSAYSSKTATVENLQITKIWQFVNDTNATINQTTKDDTWAGGTRNATLNFQIYKVDNIGTTGGTKPTSFEIKLNNNKHTFTFTVDNASFTDNFGNTRSLDSGDITYSDKSTYWDITMDIGTLFDNIYLADDYTVTININEKDGISGTTGSKTTTDMITNYVTLPTFTFSSYKMDGTTYTLTWTTADNRYRVNGKNVEIKVGTDTYVSDSQLTYDIAIVNKTKSSDYTLEYDNEQLLSISGTPEKDPISFCNNYQSSTFTVQAIRVDNNQYYRMGAVSAEATYTYAPSLSAPTNMLSSTSTYWSEGYVSDSNYSALNNKYTITFRATEGSTAFEFKFYASVDDLNSTTRTQQVIQTIVFGINPDKNDGILYLYNTSVDDNGFTQKDEITSTEVGSISDNNVTFTPTLRQLFTAATAPTTTETNNKFGLNGDLITIEGSNGNILWNLIDQAANYVFSIKSWTDDTPYIGITDTSINDGHGLAYSTLLHKVKYNKIGVSGASIHNPNNSTCINCDEGILFELTTENTLEDAYEFEIKLQLSNINRDTLWQYKTFDITITTENKNTYTISNIDMSKLSGDYYTIYVDVDDTNENSLSSWILQNLPNTLTFSITTYFNLPTTYINEGTGSTSNIQHKVDDKYFDLSYSYASSGDSSSYSLTIKRQLSTPTLEIYMDNLADLKNEETNTTPSLTNLVDNANLVNGIASNVFIRTGYDTVGDTILTNSSGVVYKLNITDEKETEQQTQTFTTSQIYNYDTGEFNVKSTGSDCLYSILEKLFPSGCENLKLQIQAHITSNTSLYVSSTTSNVVTFNFYVRASSIALDSNGRDQKEDDINTLEIISASDFNPNNSDTWMSSTRNNQTITNSLAHIAIQKVYFKFKDYTQGDYNSNDIYTINLERYYSKVQDGNTVTESVTYNFKFRYVTTKLAFYIIHEDYDNNSDTKLEPKSITTIDGLDYYSTTIGSPNTGLDIAVLINAIKDYYKVEKEKLYAYAHNSYFEDGTKPMEGNYKITVSKVTSTSSNGSICIGKPYTDNTLYFCNKVMLLNGDDYIADLANVTDNIKNNIFESISGKTVKLIPNNKATKLVFDIDNGTKVNQTIVPPNNGSNVRYWTTGENTKLNLILLGDNGILKDISTAGQYTITYYFEGEGSNIFSSTPRTFTYEHYVQVDSTALTYNVAQSEDTFEFTNITYNGATPGVTFEQRIYHRVEGQNEAMLYGINAFDPSNADCFTLTSNTDFDENILNNLSSENKDSKYTKHAGYIQAGVNVLSLYLTNATLDGYTFYPAGTYGPTNGTATTFYIPDKYFQATYTKDVGTQMSISSVDSYKSNLSNSSLANYTLLKSSVSGVNNTYINKDSNGQISYAIKTNSNGVWILKSGSEVVNAKVTNVSKSTSYYWHQEYYITADNPKITTTATLTYDKEISAYNGKSATEVSGWSGTKGTGINANKTTYKIDDTIWNNMHNSTATFTSSISVYSAFNSYLPQGLTTSTTNDIITITCLNQTETNEHTIITLGNGTKTAFVAPTTFTKSETSTCDHSIFDGLWITHRYKITKDFDITNNSAFTCKITKIKFSAKFWWENAGIQNTGLYPNPNPCTATYSGTINISSTGSYRYTEDLTYFSFEAPGNCCGSLVRIESGSAKIEYTYTFS